MYQASIIRSKVPKKTVLIANNDRSWQEVFLRFSFSAITCQILITNHLSPHLQCNKRQPRQVWGNPPEKYQVLIPV